MLAGGAHKDAMSRIFGSDFASAFSTTVWVPQCFKGLWVRCTAHNQMVDYERDNGKCGCGAELLDQPPHW